MTPTNVTPRGINRRGFLRGAAFGIAGTALLGTALSSCAPATSGGGAAATGAVALPTYLPNPLKPAPLLVGNAEGVSDVYKSFPLDGKRSVEGAIGLGGDVSMLLWTFNPPGPALQDNAYWQLINKNVNANLIPNQVLVADYNEKFSALVAADALPDIVGIPVQAVQINRLPQLVENQFEDLSEYLSGDAVLEYPNLANMKTAWWRSALYNGRIYGIPHGQQVFGPAIQANNDVFASVGIKDVQAKNLDDFLELAKAANNPKAGRYAFAKPTWFIETISAAYGAPNKWKKTSKGTFVSAYETEEFEAAVAFAASLFKAGLFHPDTATFNKGQVDSMFRSGQIAFNQEGILAYGIAGIDRESDLNFTALLPFGHDGGEGANYSAAGAYTVSFLKKSDDKERIKELLRIANYIAAPFGTKESLDLFYGVEGVDYEVVDGQPVLTPQGETDVSVGFTYIIGESKPLSNPAGLPNIDKRIYDWQSAVTPLLVDNPAAYLQSETNSKQEASLTAIMTDAVASIVQGREPVSALSSAVSKWKREGGDAVAAEFATAAEDAQ